MKPTAERVLDAAEDLFAERGYVATSMSVVAERVGIRSPSLYNHFKNKQALYVAVVDRLLAGCDTAALALPAEPLQRSAVLSWMQRLAHCYRQKPNLAKLLQHAAMANGEQCQLVHERVIAPIFLRAGMDSDTLQKRAPLFMLLHNVAIAAVTLAPIYSRLLDADTAVDTLLDAQNDIAGNMVSLMLDARGVE